MTSAHSGTDAVRAALLHAIEHRQLVALVLHGNLDEGIPARVVQGMPVGFDLSRGGGVRVMLELAAGETLQKILLERIERVLPATS